jgi:hypothetical protein
MFTAFDVKVLCPSCGRKVGVHVVNRDQYKLRSHFAYMPTKGRCPGSLLITSNR